MERSAGSNATNISDRTQRETLPALTAKGSLISRYAQTFVNRRDRYLTSTATGGWFSAKTRLTDRLLEAVLRGHRSLGLYATSETGTSLWVAWDGDTDEQAHKLLAASRLLPVDSYLIERSRRGLHLVRLFNTPVPWQAAHRYGLSFASKAGTPEVEVFPKNGTFSALRAPMTVHPVTKRTYDWIDADGQILDAWDRLLTLQPAPLPEHWLIEPSSRDPPREMHRELPGIFGQLDTGSHAEMLAEALRYVDLKQVGPERYRGYCLFHRDTRPSFGLDGCWFECFAGCLSPGPNRGGVNYFRKLVRERGL